jgi:isochorismate hydrolase
MWTVAPPYTADRAPRSMEDTMAIPDIQPYPMPTQADLPANTAPWRPDPRRAVLLLHDVQRHFVERLPANRSPEVALRDNIERLVTAARAEGLPVVFTAQPADTTARERGLLADFWGPGLAAGADPFRSAAFVAPLVPAPGDVVVRKTRYSAFHGTGLAAHLRATGRDQLIVTGVYAHIGCLATANDAFSHDLETFVVADAVADFSATHHRLALTYAAGRCAVVLTTAGVIAAVTDRAGRTRRPAGAAQPAGPAVPVN